MDFNEKTYPIVESCCEETIVTSESGGQKGQKTARFDLLPVDSLWSLAEHFGRGAEKYEDRNWEQGYDWSLSYAALLRHIFAWWGGEDYDLETSSHHLDGVMFHALALRHFINNERYERYDTRPKKENK